MTEEPQISIHGFGKCDFIGRGGFGTAYSGCDQNNGFKIVAIKFIERSQPKKNLTERKTRELFENERAMHGRLHHPSIVELFSSFDDPNGYYLVMEYCETNVEKFVREKGPMNEKLARSLFYQVIQGVDYIHKQQIIHRDLKAANIFLKRGSDEKLSAKIGDFGLATGAVDLHRTCVGSPLYMPPEILGKKDYGPSVDIWSLGMLLYHMLVGCIPPVLQKCQTADDIRNIICHEPIDVSGLRSPSSRNLVRSMLQIHPENRHTISEIIRHEWLRPEQELSDASRSNGTVDSGRGFSFGSSKSSQSSPRNQSCSSWRKTVLDPITESSFDDEGVGSFSSPRSSARKPTNRVAQAASGKTSNSFVQLNTEGLKPYRTECDDLPFVGSILESGEVVLEFLSSGIDRKPVKRIEEVIRISRDGSMMYRYSPQNAELGKKPPPLPEDPFQFHVSELQDTNRVSRRYAMAARFVDMVKSKTYKVFALFESKATGRAKCYLMRNEPHPNVETNFDEKGVKIVQTVDRVLVKTSPKAKYSRFTLDTFIRNVPVDVKIYWDLHCTYREAIIEGDQFLAEQERKANGKIKKENRADHSDVIQMLSLRRPVEADLTSRKSPPRESVEAGRLPLKRTGHDSWNNSGVVKSNSGAGYQQKPRHQEYSLNDSSNARSMSDSGKSHHSYDHVMTTSEPQWNRPSR